MDLVMLHVGSGLGNWWCRLGHRHLGQGDRDRWLQGACRYHLSGHGDAGAQWPPTSLKSWAVATTPSLTFPVL